VNAILEAVFWLAAAALVGLVVFYFRAEDEPDFYSPPEEFPFRVIRGVYDQETEPWE
jgi:hypothetical protein